jgi:hypothetical protein
MYQVRDADDSALGAQQNIRLLSATDELRTGSSGALVLDSQRGGRCIRACTAAPWVGALSCVSGCGSWMH